MCRGITNKTSNEEHNDEKCTSDSLCLGTAIGVDCGRRGGGTEGVHLRRPVEHGGRRCTDRRHRRQNLVDAGLQTEADRNTLFAYGASFSATDPQSYAWGDIRGHRGSSLGKTDPPVYVIGPEVGFARTLYAAGVHDLAIITVSANIPVPPLGPEWPWGKGTKTTSPDFYGQWAAFVGDRLAELTGRGDSYTIAGFVWDEGIDDALNGATQAEYQANLTALIAQLRADYGTPTTPFVLARSKSPMPDPAAMEAVRMAQVAVAEADPHAAWVSTDDLPNVNVHHFSAASQLTIGQREANAYLARSRARTVFGRDVAHGRIDDLCAGWSSSLAAVENSENRDIGMNIAGVLPAAHERLRVQSLEPA